MSTNSEWERCESNAFWCDIATGDHVVQIYDDDSMLLNTLADFAADGFTAGSSVVVIATENHLHALSDRLLVRGFALDVLIADDQYIPLDAVKTLSKFMVNGSPNEMYFMETVAGIMKRARKNDRQVRAFGEMVALLWERGDKRATLQLEELWNKFCSIETLCLFCAYPKQSFVLDASASVMHICSAHSKMIGSDDNFPSEIQYKRVV